MSDLRDLSRRAALIGAGASGLLLAGCNKLSQSPSFRRVLATAERLNLGAQRLIQGGRGALAREFTPADLSPVFKANGSIMPGGQQYADWLATDFAGWKLEIGGLVQHPISLSLDELKALPSRSQITRHDCVEGWSAIGGWTGVPLGLLLRSAVLLPQARYIVFHCADSLASGPLGQYYESIDLIDAFHPQTILAYAMNGQLLTAAHGAPIRLRVERQLGYKMAKYVMRIEAVDSFAHIGQGRGGFWEDRGYAWYGGI